jgi:hypothetical protein
MHIFDTYGPQNLEILITDSKKCTFTRRQLANLYGREHTFSPTPGCKFSHKENNMPTAAYNSALLQNESFRKSGTATGLFPLEERQRTT